MSAEVGDQEIQAIFARQLNDLFTAVQVTLARVEQLSVQARTYVFCGVQFAAFIDDARPTAITIRWQPAAGRLVHDLGQRFSGGWADAESRGQIVAWCTIGNWRCSYEEIQVHKFRSRFSASNSVEGESAVARLQPLLITELPHVGTVVINYLHIFLLLPATSPCECLPWAGGRLALL